MCIGIPMQVVEVDGAFAWCEGRGRRERLNALLLEELSPGDWVYATLGQAREILTPQRADEINLALDGLAAAIARRNQSGFLLPLFFNCINVADIAAVTAG